ncbi:hypothetical protein AB1K84_18215 [Mesobacillus foraminis]|jgi:hypothetical protein|uniref:hypothetical protein n=1 Tax=Mesobacillus foraminis TaxID=279826 RepID=UPI0039A1B15F
MQKITLELDNRLFGMLNELKNQYDEETSKTVTHDELLRELIVAHYYMEVKKE